MGIFFDQMNQIHRSKITQSIAVLLIHKKYNSRLSVIMTQIQN